MSANQMLLSVKEKGSKCRLELGEISSHVPEFSRDRTGSMFIQMGLIRATQKDTQMVLDGMQHYMDRAADMYVSRVIKTLLRFGNVHQKPKLLERLSGMMYSLSLDEYGCTVVEQAIEEMPSLMKEKIEKELSGHVLQCVMHDYGSRVLLKYIESVDAPNLQFIFHPIQEEIVRLSTHYNGSLVMECLVAKCDAEIHEKFANMPLGLVETCMKDKLGSRVILKCIESMDPRHVKFISNACKNKIFQLSMHEHSRHVIVALLQKPDLEDEIMEELLGNVSRSVRYRNSGWVMLQAVGKVSEGMQSTIADKMKSFLPKCVYNPISGPIILKLLDELKGNKQVMLIQKMMDSIIPCAKTECGSQMLAKALEVVPEKRQAICDALRASVDYHMQDKYCHLVVQKCIECVDPFYTQFIIESCSIHPVQLSLHAHGNNVIQSLIEHTAADQMTCVLRGIHRCIDRIIRDGHGRRVAEKILKSGYIEEKKHIIKMIGRDFFDYSCHTHATHVVQSCVSREQNPHNSGLLKKIRNNMFCLSKDRNGHRVVVKCVTEHHTQITDQIRFHIQSLMKEKYSSIVAQEYIKELTSKELARLVHRLCSVDGPPFHSLMSNINAQECFNTLIRGCDVDQGVKLLSKLRPYISALDTTVEGINILRNLYKLFDEEGRLQ